MIYMNHEDGNFNREKVGEKQNSLSKGHLACRRQRNINAKQGVQIPIIHYSQEQALKIF